MKKERKMQFDLKNKLFSGQLEFLSEKYPETIALTCEGNSVTFKQLKEKADFISKKLLNAGMKKGDKAVLWGYNTIEWIVIFMGITQIGGIAVLMNYGLSSTEVSSLSKMVGASFGFIGRNRISKNSKKKAFDTLLNSGIQQEHIYFFSEFIKSDPDIEDEDAVNNLVFAKQAVDPKDTQVIIFTTGTSSIPKAVQLSSFAIISNVEGLHSLLLPGAADTFCLALPLYHSYGMTMALFYLSIGSHLYLSPELKPNLLVEIISKNNIQDMSSVGAVYNMMLELPEFDEKIAGKMNMCIVGGSFTSPDNMIRMENKFCGAKLICGYGQTECSPVISMESYNDPLERRAVSVGHPLPNHEIKIMSPDGKLLDNGEVGEIVVKGPSLMNGYMGLPDERQAIRSDGWLHTEDLGLLNEYGMLQFSGRIKEIINRGGENISPMEIEHVLLSESEVKDVKVMGCPHPIWGESVEACLVLRTNEFDEDDLRERLKNKLAPFKIPSHFFVYDALPLNANGKLDQRSLKDDLLRRLSKLEAIRNKKA